MSNFQCEKCGTICYDTPNGYITGCEHYPADLNETPEFKKIKEQIMQLSAEDKLVVLERIMDSLEKDKNETT